MKPNDPRLSREDRQAQQPDPGSRSEAGRILDQASHTVGQAFNTAGNATIIPNPFPLPATISCWCRQKKCFERMALRESKVTSVLWQAICPRFSCRKATKPRARAGQPPSSW